MRLFLVRHGESRSNADWNQVTKPADLNSPLTEKGFQQVEKLAGWMKANLENIDAVYSSSLIRAEQTAQPIADAFHVSLLIDHRLREGGYNFTDGSPIPDDQLPLHKSVDFHLHPSEPFDPSVENCETYVQLKNRVGYFLDEMLQRYLGKTIVVSTHGWTSNAFFDVIFGSCSMRQCYFQVENTALSFFQYKPDQKLGPWFAQFIAQTPHLPFYPEGIHFE